jgi:ATP-dependent Clp protease adaptor protein ClpS
MRRMLMREQLVPERSAPRGASPQREPLYRVFIHNDDVTPMEFVVHVLTTVFLLPFANAQYVMYTAHLTGLAHVQTLPLPEARRRVNKAVFAAGLRSLPLRFSMEPE